jgi:hypothetical protein
LDSGARALKGQPVAQRHRLQERFQFVVAISPFSQDVKQEVDLAA